MTAVSDRIIGASTFSDRNVYDNRKAASTDPLNDKLVHQSATPEDVRT